MHKEVLTFRFFDETQLMRDFLFFNNLLSKSWSFSLGTLETCFKSSTPRATCTCSSFVELNFESSSCRSSLSIFNLDPRAASLLRMPDDEACAIEEKLWGRD